MKIIETSHISRRYVMGEEVIQALKDVSISVSKGEYVAFMGPSGSGKSTLMNINGCLDTPSTGKYILNNQIKWLKYAPIWFLIQATHYNRFGFHIHNSIAKQVGAINSIEGKLLVLVAVPLGWVFYLRDSYKIAKPLRSRAK